MNRKKYFYFASPHSFKYPFFINLMFIKKKDRMIRRYDHSNWTEVTGYNYYGEPVNCIIPAQFMEYGFVFGMLESENNDNIFGAINYLLFNYRDKFISDINNGICPCNASNILFKYFRKEFIA